VNLTRLLSLGLFGLFAVGCGRAVPPALGDRIPDAEFEVIFPTGTDWEAGDVVALSDFEGKPVLLDYWASWCFPCREQHAHMKELHARYGDEIQILGVLFEDSPANAEEWLEEMGAVYPTVKERNNTIVDEFWITGLPHFILLTPDRRLSWDQIGAGKVMRDSVTIRLDAMLDR